VLRILLIGIKNTINMISENNTRIAIIGLGYVDLPLAVAHDEFKKMSVSDIKAFGKKDHILYDVKYLFNSKDVDGRL